MKTVKDIGELGLIDRIRRKIKSFPGVIRGIGDDAAVIRPPKGYELITTDSLVDQVDFVLGKTPANLVGRKLLAINLSDIAAMGGRPRCAVLSLGIPSSLAVAWFDAFLSGLLNIARRYKVVLIGGDVSRAGQFWASLTLTGEAVPGKWVGRSGAKPGDKIFVTGDLGGSLRGKHLKFNPKIEEALKIVKRFRPTSMIDISDGFLQDLRHLLTESKAGAQVYADRIPVSRAAKSSLKHALSDGEDFELLFTARRFVRIPGIKITQVGDITKKPGELMIFDSENKRKRLKVKVKGYVHF